MVDLIYDNRGLAPAVVQDASTGRVLMLGYVNVESLVATEATGLMHFWSRSRNALWQKGETSGNVLEVVDMAIDCDGDALLVQAIPAGPTCHTGRVSCFSPASGSAAGEMSPKATEGAPAEHQAMNRLWTTISSRARHRPSGSYTTSLLDGGVDTCGRKVTEEATEVLIAAKDHAAGEGPAGRIVEESADLVYHLLVLLAERGVDIAEVEAELDRRAG
ncbi:MAG TPA: bifunctional phosphoribosyl-AMP cyclohydrolase/phosphoribosyl-ATP diphosphatase HisIE [Acidimicrobiia bacterium]|nr:bifunctional phosphoribosyl-AMP cyclohydrolase/phosphoribosyl-ATP diphosphatase HisIE [Acidimicrobiia bacterium]